MEAYKIRATIKRMCGGNQWTGPTDVEITSDKEYYHIKREDAIKHITDYIKVCEDNNIHFKNKNENTWVANAPNGSFYCVNLSKIDIL